MVRGLLEEREQRLSPYSVRSREKSGRDTPEETSGLRTGFQRDRGRIPHGKHFRRFMHKTRVVVVPRECMFRSRPLSRPL